MKFRYVIIRCFVEKNYNFRKPYDHGDLIHEYLSGKCDYGTVNRRYFLNEKDALECFLKESKELIKVRLSSSYSSKFWIGEVIELFREFSLDEDDAFIYDDLYCGNINESRYLEGDEEDEEI